MSLVGLGRTSTAPDFLGEMEASVARLCAEGVVAIGAGLVCVRCKHERRRPDGFGPPSKCQLKPTLCQVWFEELLVYCNPRG